MSDDLVERANKFCDKIKHCGTCPAVVGEPCTCQYGLIHELADEIGRLRTWVNDLQSGMYINCVYCGHRYGPDDEVPATMAEVLKEHIEQCPEHPMSALTAENRALREQLEQFRADAREVLGAYGDHKKDCTHPCSCGWREVLLSPGWKMPGGLADENRALRERLEKARPLVKRLLADIPMVSSVRDVAVEWLRDLDGEGE